MFSHYFHGIEGIATYPVLSLLIFFPFFLVVTWYVWKLDKQYVKRMSQLPLEDSENETDNN